MKKLIAISVMIALLASAVFAETTVSGAVETQLNVYSVEMGDWGEKYDGGFPKAKTSGGYGTAHIQLETTNGDGTMGGMFRLRGQDIAESDFRWHRVFVWWKPIPQVKIFLGQDADGMFERGQLTSWGFHQFGQGFITVHDWDFWRNIFPGNWDTFGAAFSFYVLDGLELNLVIPTGQPNGWPRHHNGAVTRATEVDNIYPGSLQLTSSYQIGDVGKVHFAWIGSGEKYNEDTNTYGKIGLSFYSNSLVQGLAFQVGGSTDIKSSDEEIVPESQKAPISLGAAVHFNAGDLGIKWRLGTDIATNDSGAVFLTTNIMPTYNLPIGTVGLDIGFSQNIANKDADAEVGFWLNPYLKKDINGGYFQAGILYLNNIGGGQGGSHSVAKNDRPRLYFPVVLGINF